MTKIVKRVTLWYGKYERPISSISLVGGFLFDAVTLKRVDVVAVDGRIIGRLRFNVIVSNDIVPLENKVLE